MRGIRTFFSILWSGAILLFIAYLAAVLIAFFYLSPSIVRGILTGNCTRCLGALLLVNPFWEPLFLVWLLSGQSFLLWLSILLGLLVGIYLYLILFHGRSTYGALRLPLRRLSDRLRSESVIITVGQIFVAILFFDLVYFTLFLPAIGIQPESPASFRELPEWYQMYGLVEAAFTEEIAIRVVLIGAPLALGSLVIRLFQTSRASVGGRPRGIGFVASSLKYLAGGQVNSTSPRSAQILGVVLIILSAAFFGYLHVITWGVLWKFVDTFVGGLALGYLFLRKGVAASILLHFSINAFSLLLTASGGEDSILSVLLIGVFYLALAALGAGFFFFYLRETGRLLLKPLLKPSKGIATKRLSPRGELPGPPGESLFRVDCPDCGAKEAVYEEGVVKCAACGRRL